MLNDVNRQLRLLKHQNVTSSSNYVPLHMRRYSHGRAGSAVPFKPTGFQLGVGGGIKVSSILSSQKLDEFESIKILQNNHQMNLMDYNSDGYIIHNDEQSDMPHQTSFEHDRLSQYFEDIYSRIDPPYIKEEQNVLNQQQFQMTDNK